MAGAIVNNNESYNRVRWFYRSSARSNGKNCRKISLNELEIAMVRLDKIIYFYEEGRRDLSLAINPEFRKQNDYVLEILNLGIVPFDKIDYYKRRYHDLIGRVMVINGALA